MILTIYLNNENSCMGCPCLDYEKSLCRYFGLAIANTLDFKNHVHSFERPNTCKENTTKGKHNEI